MQINKVDMAMGPNEKAATGTLAMRWTILGPSEPPTWATFSVQNLYTIYENKAEVTKTPETTHGPGATGLGSPCADLWDRGPALARIDPPAIGALFMEIFLRCAT